MASRFTPRGPVSIRELEREFGPRERQLDFNSVYIAAPTPASDLTTPQKYALLSIRLKGAGEDSLVAAVLRTMNAMGAERMVVAQSDWLYLRTCGYLTKRTPQSADEITPPGLWKADQVARELAKAYPVHFITRRAGRRWQSGPSAHCSCCHFSCTRTNSRGNGLEAAIAAHLAAVSNGTWKPPRSVSEIYDATVSVAAVALPQHTPRAPGDTANGPGAVGTEQSQPRRGN